MIRKEKSPRVEAVGVVRAAIDSARPSVNQKIKSDRKSSVLGNYASGPYSDRCKRTNGYFWVL